MSVPLGKDVDLPIVFYAALALAAGWAYASLRIQSDHHPSIQRAIQRCRALIDQVVAAERDVSVQKRPCRLERSCGTRCCYCARS